MFSNVPSLQVKRGHIYKETIVPEEGTLAVHGAELYGTMISGSYKSKVEDHVFINKVNDGRIEVRLISFLFKFLD